MEKILFLVLFLFLLLTVAIPSILAHNGCSEAMAAVKQQFFFVKQEFKNIKIISFLLVR